MGEISRGIESADLPLSAKSMLHDMLEGSLGVPAQERDRFQNQIVDIVGEVLMGARSGLQRRVDLMDGAVAEAKRQKQELEVKSEAKGHSSAAKHEGVTEKKLALAAVAKRFKSVHVAAAEARAACEATEGELRDAVESKEQLEGLLTGLLRPLAEGTLEEAEAQEKMESLIKRMTALNVDEPLSTVLPVTLAKAPDARGSFDVMILTSADEDFGARIAALDATIREAEPTRAARCAALLRAEALLESATQEQVEAADIYGQESREAERLDEELDDVKRELTRCREAKRKHERERIKAADAVKSFEEGPMAALAAMRTTAQVATATATAVETTVDAEMSAQLA